MILYEVLGKKFNNKAMLKDSMIKLLMGVVSEVLTIVNKFNACSSLFR